MAVCSEHEAHLTFYEHIYVVPVVEGGSNARGPLLYADQQITSPVGNSHKQLFNIHCLVFLSNLELDCRSSIHYFSTAIHLSVKCIEIAQIRVKSSINS